MSNKKPLTAKERKAKERLKRRDSGFIKKEAWVHETQLDMWEDLLTKFKKPK